MKGDEFISYDGPAMRAQRRRRWQVVRAQPVLSGIITCFVLGLLTLSRITGCNFRSWLAKAPQNEHIWSYLEPQPRLDYIDCYDDFQCSRLEVPLDWHNQSNPKRVNVAVIRSPARVPVDDHRYAGPIVLNPGGPGGSGVAVLLALADKFRDIVDTDDKAYDIVSFDPRGVGFTDPPLVCFDEALYEQSFGQRMANIGIPGSSDVALATHFGLTKGLGGACQPGMSDSIKHHLTTPYVARDMLALIEAHGIWRENVVHGKVPSEFDPAKELLQYWGLSYGSLLGGTFASMFPDRVGRLVLDGVVDSEDYYSATWTGNLADTESVFDAFFDGCAAAGWPTCPLAQHGTTGKSLRKIFEAALTDVRSRPIPVTGHHAGGIMTWSEVKTTISSTLYTPIAFQALSFFVDMIVRSHNSSIISQVLVPPIGQARAHGFETTLHILCTDGDSQANVTLADSEKRLQKLREQSPISAEVFYAVWQGCSGVTLRSPWTFDKSKYGANETSNPILFVGNTADPVTPLANAHRMSRRFAGSHVLQQDGVGHCSIAQYSQCTTSLVREYFATGQLPPEGKVCPVDWHPFEPPAAVEQTIASRLSDWRDVRAARAHIELQRSFWDVSGAALGQLTFGQYAVRQFAPPDGI